MTEHGPGWHADPGGRHEHRYWDGARWTDDVADAGVTSRDPLAAATGAGGATDPTVVSSSDPTATLPTAGTGTPPAMGSGDPVGDRPGANRGLVLGLAALVAVALVVAGVLLLGGDDDDGDGVLAGDRSELDADSPFGDLDAGPGGFTGSDDLDDLADLEDLGDLDGLGIGGIDESDFDPADMIGSVARIYEESLGLSSSQARCLAEELLGAFDDTDTFDDELPPDAFAGAFDAFDACGISLADLYE